MTQLAAEQRAWRLLVAAFMAFVVLCAASLYGVYWFIFQSFVQLNITATAARGTAQVDLPEEQVSVAIPELRRDMEIGSTVHTDTTSEVVISFTDPNTDLPLAYLYVLRDSVVRLQQAQAPRFSLNSSPYQIQLTAIQGKCIMVIVNDTQRPVSFSASSLQGSMDTTSAGQYTVEVTQDWTRVSVKDGEADLVADQDSNPLHLSSNQHAYLAKGIQAQHPVVDKSLVDNGQFTAPYSAGWKAYSNGDPVGVVSSGTVDGLPVVTIDRGQERWPDLILDHGETGLVQSLNVDVSNYNSLELQASFYVQEQSLSTCGVAGSECPLMIRVVYTDSGGNDRVYIHGFYAFQDANLGYPTLCDTCRSEHDRVRMQTWYTYNENLFSILPPEQRPQFIREIWFYASGHAYIVHIAQMDLVGTKLRPPGSTSN